MAKLPIKANDAQVKFKQQRLLILVDVIFNGQQVVAHSLKGELVQDRWDGVKSPIQNDQLWASLIRTLQREMHNN